MVYIYVLYVEIRNRSLYLIGTLIIKDNHYLLYNLIMINECFGLHRLDLRSCILPESLGIKKLLHSSYKTYYLEPDGVTI